jgi:DNA adenine methylase
MRLLEQNNLKNIHYVEPYAGGAAIALALLFEEYASTVHINDLSRPVYAFWHSVLNHTDRLCKDIGGVEVTVGEWLRQRSTYNNREHADLFELGFATLFLNRTNRSGVLNGGIIGGKNQTGPWPINARFNKDELIQRISKIARYKNRIKLYQLDALDFTRTVVPSMGANSFLFYDPPYIEKGDALYLNSYDIDDHRQLAEQIIGLHQPWVVTYDYEAASIHNLYPLHRRLVYDLSYSAQGRSSGREVMFISQSLKLPDEWESEFPVTIVPPKQAHKIYGRIVHPQPNLLKVN